MLSFKQLLEASKPPDPNKPIQRGILMVQDKVSKTWRMNKTFNNIEDAKEAAKKIKAESGMETKVVGVPSREEELKKDIENSN